MTTPGRPATRPIPVVAPDAANAKPDTIADAKADAKPAAKPEAAAAAAPKPAEPKPVELKATPTKPTVARLVEPTATDAKAGGAGSTLGSRAAEATNKLKAAARSAGTAARNVGSAASGTSAAPGTGAAAGAAGAAGAGATAAAASPGARPTAPRPRTQAPQERPTGRRVRLAVTRIDPWSAMKMSLLLSTAAAIGLIIGTMLLWSILNGMGVFGDIDGLVKSLQNNTADPFSIMDYVGLPRVTSLAMVVGVFNVVILTAIGTLGAYLYNICAALVGGVQLTLTDD